MHRFLHRFAPQARRLPYAEEMWELFQRNALTPDTQLVGRYRPSERSANTHAVLELIQEANYDERKRRESLGLRGGPPRSSNPRPPSSPYQERPQHRPHPSSRDAQRSEPLRNNAPPGRGPLQDAPSPSHQARVEPPRHGPPRNQPPRSGTPPRDRPRPNGAERDGSPPQNAAGRPNSNRSDGRAPLSGAVAARPNGRRDEGRGVEVIVARRPPMPR
jgi:RIO kinase 1